MSDSKYLKEFLDKQINVDNEKNIEPLLNQIRKIFW